MALLIGTDEAGYGPSLGPLAICGTAWQVPDADIDLYAVLRSVVSTGSGNEQLTIADSKTVYKSGDSLEKLEVAVLAALHTISDTVPRSLGELGSILGAEIRFSPHPEFAACRDKVSIPVAAPISTIRTMADRFRQDCDRHRVRIHDIRCQAIYPDVFNRLLTQYGNKAELLSCATLKLVHELMVADMESIRIVCDKFGGRNRYLGLIQHHLTDELVQIGLESRRLSRYSWREGRRQRDLMFSAGGESFLPTALASMVAKYVRELAMKVWNQFWCLRVSDLRPTAGYPVDARRFKQQIRHVQARLGIPDELIWRNR